MVSIKQLSEAVRNGESIVEAKFDKKKLRRVSDLLASIIGKGEGGTYNLLGAGLGEDKFKKKDGNSGYGFKYITSSGNLIRFGFYDKSKNKYGINVVDFWDKSKGAGLFTAPTTTIELYDWMNIVDVVEELKDIIIRGKMENFSEAVINEWDVPKKMKAYALTKGIEWNGETGSRFEKILKDAGVWDEDEYKGFKVKKGVDEENNATVTVTKAEKILDKKKYSDPDVVFDDIEKLAKVVAMGLQNSLIVCGAAGVGKTFHVEKSMKTLLGSPNGPDAQWRYRQGAKLSPMGLYFDLFMNRDNMTIVYDDSDSVFSDKDGINMLKSALDTKKERVLFWNSPKTQNIEILSPEEQEEYYAKLYDAMLNKPEDVGTKIKLPNTFNFTSRVIFISNLPGEKFQKDADLAAIASRSLFMDIQLTLEDRVRRIKSIIEFISPEIALEEKQKVVDQLSASGKELTMRAVVAAIAIKESGESDWERLTREYTAV